MKRRVSEGSIQSERNQRRKKKLDDVKPWKQGKERDSNRSCWSTVLTFPGKEKKFCTCRNFSCTMGISIEKFCHKTHFNT